MQMQLKLCPTKYRLPPVPPNPSWPTSCYCL